MVTHMANVLGAFNDMIEAYAAIKSAAKQMSAMNVGEQGEADIPDIDLRFRKGGKQFSGRIVAVIVERDG